MNKTTSPCLDGWFTIRLAKDEELRERFNAARRCGCHVRHDEMEDKLDELDLDLRQTKKVMTEHGEIEVPKYDGKTAQALVNAARTRIRAYAVDSGEDAAQALRR